MPSQTRPRRGCRAPVRGGPGRFGGTGGDRLPHRHYGIGARQRAIEYYERSLRREETPLTLNNLAWLYAEEGVQLERALDLSLRAVKSDPDNVVYLDTYAELLFLLGQGPRATALLELALKIEPPGGEQYDYLLGQLEKFRGVAAVSVLPEVP